MRQGRIVHALDTHLGAFMLGALTIALVVAATVCLIGEPDQTNRANVGVGLLTGAVVSASLAVVELVLTNRQRERDAKGRSERDRQALVLLLGADSNLDGIDLSGKDLSGVLLRNKSMRYARLVGTTLRAADLSGTDLTGANLLGADLTGAMLARTRFDEAMLCGAILDHSVSPGHARLAERDELLELALTERVEAVAQNLKISDSEELAALHAVLCWSPTFKGANLVGTTFHHVKLRGSDLRDAVLTCAQFGSADLDFSDFSRCTIRTSLSTIELAELEVQMRMDAIALAATMHGPWTCSGPPDSRDLNGPMFAVGDTDLSRCVFDAADIAPEIQQLIPERSTP